MTLEELKEKAIAYSSGELELDKYELDVLKGKAMAKGWDVALILDRLNGIDPYQQSANSPRVGTANKHSMTYKIRKVLGYSYP